MVGLPSQLGLQIVNDICKKPVKLDGCCCEGAALALWSLQLPSNIRAHVSGKPFTKDTYKEVFQAADEVYLSSKQVTVAALMTEKRSTNLNETQPAFSQQNQPVVAAVAANRGGGARSGTNRGGNSGRGGRNRGRGRGGSGNQSRGPRHSSNPPDSCCDRHFRHGADAWYCLLPLSCPWASKVTAKP